METKKVILITGASSGIGKDAALQLISEGHIVYGAARRLKQMQDLVKAGGHALALDLTDETQIVAGVQQVLSEQNRIDVLINNAGYGLYGAVEDISMEAARHQFDVNMFGLARITKEVLPQMRKQKSGKIINISSVGGRIYSPLGAWYYATKHALEGWSDCLRLELKPFGIDVVVIQPGLIATEFADMVHAPILKISGQGAYAKLAQKTAQAMKSFGEKKGAASPPAVITRVIVEAIRSSKPKTRYVAGKMAKMLLWMRKYMGDRTFDKLIMRKTKEL